MAQSPVLESNWQTHWRVWATGALEAFEIVGWVPSDFFCALLQGADLLRWSCVWGDASPWMLPCLEVLTSHRSFVLETRAASPWKVEVAREQDRLNLLVQTCQRAMTHAVCSHPAPTDWNHSSFETNQVARIWHKSPSFYPNQDWPNSLLVVSVYFRSWK